MNMPGPNDHMLLQIGKDRNVRVVTNTQIQATTATLNNPRTNLCRKQEATLVKHVIPGINRYSE